MISNCWQYRLFAPLALFLLLLACPAYAAYSGGDGTWNNPWIIASASDFQFLMNNPSHWSKNFILATNISLSGMSLSPIGNGTTMFTGSFDGNFHKISNITINKPTETYVGLFGYLQSTALVQNLTLENVSVTGGQHAGALAGYNKGSIFRCSSKGSVSASSSSLPTYAGGLIGYCYISQPIYDNYSSCSVTSNSSNTAYAGGLIGRCDNLSSALIAVSYATGTVSSPSAKVIAGALVGYAVSTNIDSCYATGSVTASNSNSLSSLGGFIGNNSGGWISNSYANGSLTAKSGNLGGFAGLNLGDIIYCYSTGKITAATTLAAGGLIGSGTGNCDSSFWDKQTSTFSSSNGGTGQTTTQMKSLATFTSAGWDFNAESANGFSDSWHMPFASTGYPMLFFQKDIPGDICCDYGVDYIDYMVLADYWKITSSNPSWNYAPDLFPDSSNSINFKDLSILASNWLKGI